MGKFRTRFAAIFLVFFMFQTLVGSFGGVSAAVVKPKLTMVTQPAREYKPGDKISFTVTSPNYGGKVQYRVILYNGTTKTTSELWKTPKTGYYYTGWMPAGNYKFTIHWPVTGMEPGAYSLTVLVKRAGAAVPYDSYVDTNSFWVKTDGSTGGNVNPPESTPSPIVNSSAPQLQLVTPPAAEYKPGDSISFTVTSPNYSGQVQYRVILYNGTTKTTSELWKTPKTGYYYTGWMPAGNYKFNIHWPVAGMEPGAYSLTVLVKRAGASVPYDSHVDTNSFWVTGDISTFSKTHGSLMTTSDIVKAYDKSIVGIETLDENGEVISLGSGISIGRGLILTNLHVLDAEGVKAYRIVTNDGKEYSVNGIVVGDGIRDLAIIKAKQQLELLPVKLASYKTTIKGEKIITIGNPYGLQNTVSEGIVSGLHYLSEFDTNLIQISAPITHGSSGGALFNMWGEVIGITSMGYEEGNLNFAVAADHIIPWLDELRGMSFSDIPIAARTIDTSTMTEDEVPIEDEIVPTSILGSSCSIMGLNFGVTDSVMDPNKPVIYVSDRASKKLYSINYETKEVKQTSFSLVPESIDYANGRVFVALLKQDHDPYIFDGEQQGAFAIVDSESMKILDTVDIDIDPFDIIADRDGFIYISSGSGQWTKMKSYSAVTRQEISSTNIGDGSYAEYNPINDKIYLVDKNTTPVDIEAREINKGMFTSSYNSPYHGDYEMNTKIKVSPDGKYVFNGGGTVFTSSPAKDDDLKYAAELYEGFVDIAFNGSSKLYTVNNSQRIYEYNYSDLEVNGYYKTIGVPEKLFYKNNKLLAITKTSGLGTAYSLEEVNFEAGTGDTPQIEEMSMPESYPSYVINTLMNLSFQISDIVMDPVNPVIYALDRADKKLYKVNYETKAVTQAAFTLPPQGIDYRDGKVYVALLKQEHSPYINIESQKGAYAVVNAATMGIINTFDINIDPYAIVAGNDGYLYITSGSGQTTKYKSFIADTGKEISSITAPYYGSLALYNPSLNKLYTLDTMLSPRDFDAYSLENGSFGATYDSPYHGDYPFADNIKLSPDSKYIFSGSGVILTSSEAKADDLLFAGRLNKGYLDVGFDEKNRFYTSQINSDRIYVYDYTTLEGIDSFKIDGTAQYLNYRDGKLIAITKKPKATGSTLYNYSIQSIDIQ